MQTQPTTRTAPHLLKPITAGRCGNNSKAITAERQLRCRGFHYKTHPFIKPTTETPLDMVRIIKVCMMFSFVRLIL